MIGLFAQIIRFGCVGVAAMLLHLAVVSGLVPLGLHPLSANGVAFLAAFQLSYAGHRWWTFGKKDAAGSYGRMFVVSLSSFALNEVLYFALLRLAPWDYRVSLAMVLGVVAAVTYLASRRWVFA